MGMKKTVITGELFIVHLPNLNGLDFENAQWSVTE